MKPRKAKDLQRVLLKKGFVLYPEKEHHQFYYLVIDGKKSAIKTYFSHGKADYDKTLMSMMKKQLRFKETSKAEDFFDCPLSKEAYIAMLRTNGDIK